MPNSRIFVISTKNLSQPDISTCSCLGPNFFEWARFIFCKILEGELNTIMDQNLTHYIHEHPSNIRFHDWKGNIGSASLNSVKML
jgi:hypothetical protein